jgi:hypothetical protein
MSTLTYTHSDLAPAAEAARTPARKPLWRRAYERMVAAQMRRAEREIASYIEHRGGILTDETEREIMRRMSGGTGSRPF